MSPWETMTEQLKDFPVGHFDPQESTANKFWNYCLIKSGNGTFCPVSKHKLSTQGAIFAPWRKEYPQRLYLKNWYQYSFLDDSLKQTYMMICDCICSAPSHRENAGKVRSIELSYAHPISLCFQLKGLHPNP